MRLDSCESTRKTCKVVCKFCGNQEVSRAIQQVILVEVKILSLKYGFGPGSIGMGVVYGGLCGFIGVSRHKVHMEIRGTSLVRNRR